MNRDAIKMNTIDKKIDDFEKCHEKARCNCFNNNARYICSDAMMCSLINYYKKQLETTKRKDYLNPGDRQSVIDLLHILLYIIFDVEKDNFDGVKKTIEQYGYMGKKEFVFQMIDKISRLGD